MCVKPGAIYRSELANEGEDRDVRKPALVAAKISMIGKTRFQTSEELKTRGTVVDGIGGVTVRVLVAIKVVLEGGIICLPAPANLQDRSARVPSA